MKNLTILFLFISLFAQAGCKKEVYLNPKPTPKKSILDIKWYKPFYSDSSAAYFQDPYFYDDYVVFCSDLPLNPKMAGGIKAYNKLTGALHPMWSQNPTYTDEISSWALCGPNNEIAAFNNGKKLFATELSTGTILWSHDYNPYSALPSIATFGNNIVHTFGPGGLSKTWAKMVEFNCQTGTMRELITLNCIDNYEFFIKPPALYILPNLDTILLFVTSGWNFALSNGRVDAYAYNLTQDSILWMKSNISVTANASSYKPIIIDDLVIFQGQKSNICINIHTGEIVWNHQYLGGDHNGQVESLYADGRLFVRLASRVVLAYNAKSGDLLWQTGPYYGIQTGGKMGYYKGKLYFTGTDKTDPNFPGLLFCINAANGALVWKDGGTYGNGMSDGIIIDQNTGYLYVNNSSFILCIDLNNTPKQNNQ